MGKQRKGGLPYLKTSLRFDWDSGRGVAASEQKALISDVLSHLEGRGCRSDCVEPSSSTQFSTFVNETAGFGLQACLDLVKTDSSPIVFLDSSCPRPSAVANALGLYFNNYAGTVRTYCLQGVEEEILNRLNRRADAVVLRNCPEELRARLESTLKTVHLQTGRSSGSYTPVSLIKSQGKAAKVK
ncbi:hypothetical protein ANCDUO_00419 [Ancylostoma duodenale]|uniref:Uncharacterized protein n=1 Tax=Ancylostoma duodenale TaxID=51022 RepID=A0A0C2HC48_9BILA|nr:hypothetical protein ANCDUO_00419 [Ancylostoma duodenale]